MSQKNVEIVRGGFEAFNEGDVDGVVEMCDPKVEWFPPAALPSVSVYHGHKGVREAAGDMLDVFGALQAEPERFIDADDRVVVFFRWHGHGKGSGLSLDRFGEQASVFTMRNGKAIRVEWYIDRAEALDAVGLEE
jgi:ketosteroid isomerase-like protein